jgi:hypothetical protein
LLLIFSYRYPGNTGTGTSTSKVAVEGKSRVPVMTNAAQEEDSTVVLIRIRTGQKGIHQKEKAFPLRGYNTGTGMLLYLESQTVKGCGSGVPDGERRSSSFPIEPTGGYRYLCKQRKYTVNVVYSVADQVGSRPGLLRPRPDPILPK